MAKLIANVFVSLQDGQLICAGFDRVELLLNDNKVAHAFEREWATALDRLLHSESVDDEKKKHYSDRFGSILDKFRRKTRMAS
jgi:hypothetical protein